jgi:DNA-binding transcriptional LysR family regulator
MLSPKLLGNIKKVSDRYLISLPSAQLLQLLRIGEIDVLLTSSSGVEPDLKTLGEFNFSVGAFVSKDLIKNTKVATLESFVQSSELPFVLPSKMTSLRSEIDAYFIRKKINPACVFESNIISSVIRAATDNMGITILPQIYVARELRSEKLVSLAVKPLWKHRLTLISSRQTLEESRSNFADKLVQQLSDTYEQNIILK